MKKLLAVAAAVSIIAFAGISYGEMGGHCMKSGMMGHCAMDGQMMSHEQHMSKIMMDLNLDDQQKAAMGRIKSKTMKDTIRRMADMRVAEIELKDLLIQDSVDMKAVDAKVRQLSAMKAEMQLAHIRAMEECKAMLNPVQLKKLREMLENMPMMGGMGMKKDVECGMKK